MLHALPIQHAPVAHHAPHERHEQRRYLCKRRMTGRLVRAMLHAIGWTRCQMRHHNDCDEEPCGRYVKQPLSDERADWEEDIRHRQKAQQEDPDAEGQALAQDPTRARGGTKGFRGHESRLREREVRGARQQQPSVCHAFDKGHGVHGVVVTQEERPDEKLHVHPMDEHVRQLADPTVVTGRDWVAVWVHPCDLGARSVPHACNTAGAADDEQHGHTRPTAEDSACADGPGDAHDLPGDEKPEEREACLLADAGHDNHYHRHQEPEG
mmetsp:Transcript_108232/g.305015  ORF Transcript_108232/g.305015 Transcript_108232/m.305015 type:complete len:267 (+) Transcript_108232:714-1514(+)